MVLHLIPSSFGYPGISSNTFCACTGRAQSAPIVATRPSRHAGPLALAHTAAPRHALPASQPRAKPPWHATAPPPGRSWRHSGVRSGSSHGQHRPSLARSPPGPWSSASSSASVSASPRRRHVALATERRFAGELIHGRRGTALPRYKREAPSVSKPSGSLMPSH